MPYCSVPRRHPALADGDCGTQQVTPVPFDQIPGRLALVGIVFIARSNAIMLGSGVGRRAVALCWMWVGRGVGGFGRRCEYGCGWVADVGL